MKSMTKLTAVALASLGLASVSYAAPAENACIAKLKQEPAMFNAYLEGCQLTDQDVPALVNFLTTSGTTYNTLYLDSNALTGNGIAKLIAVSQIHDISATGNNLKNSDVELITAALKTKDSLRSLNLGHNDIDVKGVAALAAVSNVKNLGLSQTPGVNDDTVQLLARNTSFEQLDLSNDKLTLNAIDSLSKSSNVGLYALFLDENNLDDQAAKKLANSPSVKIVSLARNKISDAGATALAQSQTIDTLNLTDNQVTENGANALGRDEHLVKIDLSGNAIKDADLSSFAHHLLWMDVNLSRNQLGDQAFASLASANFGTLNVSMNPITDKGALDYAARVQNVILLNITATHITSVGIDALSALIADHRIGFLINDQGRTAAKMTVKFPVQK